MSRIGVALSTVINRGLRKVSTCGSILEPPGAFWVSRGVLWEALVLTCGFAPTFGKERTSGEVRAVAGSVPFGFRTSGAT
eukprot:1012462-Pyramimonas_sp.AAC.1